MEDVHTLAILEYLRVQSEIMVELGKRMDKIISILESIDFNTDEVRTHGT